MTGRMTSSFGSSIEIRNEDLANLADIGFFTVSRLLKKWERLGAVAKSRGRVLIRCPEKLLTEEAFDQFVLSERASAGESDHVG